MESLYLHPCGEEWKVCTYIHVDKNGKSVLTSMSTRMESLYLHPCREEWKVCTYIHVEKNGKSVLTSMLTRMESLYLHPCGEEWKACTYIHVDIGVNALDSLKTLRQVLQCAGVEHHLNLNKLTQDRLEIRENFSVTP